MNKSLMYIALAAITVIGFGVADTTHADGATPPPAGGLAALTAQPDVSGHVGPIAMPDGTEVAVITRSDVAAMMGTVELAVGRPDGWVVGQSFPIDGFEPNERLDRADPAFGAHLQAAAAQDDGGATQVIRGLVQNEFVEDGQWVREGVPDVRIVVETADGEVIAEGVTDAEGNYQVGIAEPGTYNVRLDTDTLPEGLTIYEGDADTYEDVPVRADSSTTRAFFLSDTEALAAEEAAEEAAEAAFVAWFSDTYRLEFSAVVPAFCRGVTDSQGWCGGATSDGQPVGAKVTITDDAYEFTSDFLDVPSLDTALSTAVTTCVTAEDAEYDYTGYDVLDQGHSLVVHSSGGFDCVREELGLPDWISERVSYDDVPVWQTLTFDGYTITWIEERVIIYDGTVT